MWVRVFRLPLQFVQVPKQVNKQLSVSCKTFCLPIYTHLVQNCGNGARVYIQVGVTGTVDKVHGLGNERLVAQRDERLNQRVIPSGG